MDLEIKELTPNLSEDYLYFFDEVAHEDCYCVCYSSDDQTGYDFQSKDVRRNYALKYIKEGKIRGFLAYKDGKVIGWCNVNDRDECYQCQGWNNMLSAVKKEDTDHKGLKIKSIFCFTISPVMRRHGIAAKFLEYVLNDAKKKGYDVVEAYPYKEFINIYYDHMGPYELYKKYDFTTYQELGKRVVLRKDL
ncbi:MAG: GNAT family N-acetyltransferase [Clostridiales bacterium]|nr:GNAT family N-acetyltransferase [Clostridiales bacterium]